MTERRALTDPAVQQALGRTRRSKYRAVPVVQDGLRFASKREHARWIRLTVLERVGVIHRLTFQPSFDLHVMGVKVARYVADFMYEMNDGERVVEDAKGIRTPTYRLKAKMLQAEYGVTIREV